MILALLTLATHFNVSAQSVAIKFPITVQDTRGHSATMYIGVHPLASYCRDDDTLKNFCDAGTVFELGLPPTPINDTLFDVRLTDPRGFNGDCMDLGLSNNIHPFISTSQIDTFRIDFRNTIGYPFTFSWPAYLSYYCDSMRMKDEYNANVLNVNMLTQTSAQLNEPLSAALIYMYGLKQHVCPPGISGAVFNDYNSNGMRDVGEPGITGWRIRISGSVTDSTLTDIDGFYSFNNLPGGTYTITEAPQAGWTQTMPLSGSYTVAYALENFSAGNDFGNFHGGSISGLKFNDQNKNGIEDQGEPGLANWTINLSGAQNGQTTTAGDGSYSFTHLLPGTYTISEVQQDDWVQTYPGGAGTYSVTINADEDHTGIDFGNAAGVTFQGTSGSSYTDPSNWPNNQLPTSNDIVIIPTDVYKPPPPPGNSRKTSAAAYDSVQGIRILSGGSLISQTNAVPFNVALKVEIDEGGTLQFPADDTTASLVCYGDWINDGTFSAGQSTIVFAGAAAKFIVDKSSGGGGGFQQVLVAGTNTSSLDNLTVNNVLTLENSITLQANDTLFITDPSPGAIADTGLILGGTIVRNILQGETSPYRFESPETFVQFDGSGQYPASLAMSTVAGGTPRSFDLPWQTVGGSVNITNHTVAANSIRSFSKWSMGVAATGKSASTLGEPRVSRYYRISNNGGSGFNTQLQLRYDPSEIFPSTNESDLQLLHGPVIIDNVATRWNMISLPLVPDLTLKDSLFPTSSSQAYAYQGGYTPKTDLQFGKGYWLKFPSTQQIQIIGSDVEEESLAVTKGWNLIGALSFPMSTVSAHGVSPVNITSPFWGYNSHGYKAVDTLKPLHGYWVKASADGKIVLSTTSGNPKVRSISSQLDNFNVLNFQDPEGSTQQLYFGSNTNISLLQFEMPPVPPPDIFDVRFTSQRNVVVNNSDKEEDIPISVSSIHYPVTVNWHLKSPNANASLVIDGKITRLQASMSVQVEKPGSVIILRLTSAPVVPQAFRLEQNYPNPFNPVTTIQYRLPVTSKVVLKVYNLLGQEVKTLVDGIEDEGLKSVQWKSENSSGTPLATGIYFYRLGAVSVSDPGKSFTQVKKMLLIK